MLTSACRRLLVLTALAVLHAPPCSAWTGDPSPHDGAHLIVVRPANWRLADGPRFQAPLATNYKESPFGQVVAANHPLLSYIQVKHAGRYDLWIHRRTAKTAPPAP